VAGLKTSFKDVNTIKTTCCQMLESPWFMCLERPFQQIAEDFALHARQQFLIVVNCNTDLLDLLEMGKDTTTLKSYHNPRNQFCHTAVPNLLWSDGRTRSVHVTLTSKVPPNLGRTACNLLTTL